MNMHSQTTRLMAFRDYDPWFKPDQTGFNKVGYVTSSETVIFPLRSRIKEKSIADIARYRHQILVRQFSPNDASNIEAFFTKNHRHFSLVNRGLKKLISTDAVSYFYNPIHLPLLPPISLEEVRNQWELLASNLQPCDYVAVFDTQSTISRLIAKFDQGPWSHVGIYLGDGKVCEAITSGVTQREIDVYRSPRYRVGIYRLKNLENSQKRKMKDFALSQLGKSYNYSGVFLVGLGRIFGDRRTLFRGPNGLVCSEDFELIHTV